MRTEPTRAGPTDVVRVVAFALAALPSTGCVSLPAPPAALFASSPAFSPERFFAGRTEGSGTIAIIVKGRRAVHVHGDGRLRPDGTIDLSQRVVEDGKPPRQRTWRLRQVSPGRYTGTLSDAAGPVAGETDGNMLHLRFRMPGGLAAEQRLYLQPDGRTVLNRMTVRKLGIVVAVLSETISKVD